jgi:putative ATP-dependent endonuclease of OLD family
MIERIIIEGYRCFERLDLHPNAGLNILVGDNESGKSTLLEAIALALTGKVNGRWAQEELNPFWFNQKKVSEFFAGYGTAKPVAPPQILIELYFSQDDALQHLRAVHNSAMTDCPGVLIRIAPSKDYESEFRVYMEDSPPPILPVEFYEIDWRDFSDKRLTQRPKELATSFIDSRTIRSSSGVDYHTRQMLSEHLAPRERAQISLAHRKSRQDITDSTLAEINVRIAKKSASLHNRPIGLQMDQSSRTSWETGIVPVVDNIPFAMSGQGQQAVIKVALAMSRTEDTVTFVLIEEPENHLSHTTLTSLVSRIEAMASENQQLFVTTHSSFVLNRLGLQKLHLLHNGNCADLADLGEDTANYFRKLPGYDTLRLVLARKLALVEGPSDEIILERAFRDITGKAPNELGVDIVAMGGLTFRRALEVCACLKRQAVALQDNDGKQVAEVQSSVADLLVDGQRQMLVSDPANGKTLEPQIIAANPEALLRSVLGLTVRADLLTWMTDNKSEAALRILDASERITHPDYILRAVELLK